MQVKVITPPSIEAITLDEARIFLRIDVPGFSGDTSQDTVIRSLCRAAREHVQREIDHSIGLQTLLATADRFYELASDQNGRRMHTNHLSIFAPGWEQGQWSHPMFGLALPMGPVRTIGSIKYYDAAGADQTMDSATYRLTANGRVVLVAPATTWPVSQWSPESVRVTYDAGYGVAGDRDLTFERVGEDLVTAMRLLLTHFYVNRSASVMNVRAPQVLPIGVTELLRNSRNSIGI